MARLLQAMKIENEILILVVFPGDAECGNTYYLKWKYVCWAGGYFFHRVQTKFSRFFTIHIEIGFPN
jgi:hypothetical protein